MKRTKIRADLGGRAMAWLFLMGALLGCLLALTLRPAHYASYWAGAQAGGTIRHILRIEPSDALFEAVPQALNGDLDALRMRVRDLEGNEQDAFGEHEITHMADVAHLYRLAKAVLAVCMLGLAALALWNRSRVRRGSACALGIIRGALWGIADVLLAAAAIGAWAMMDFRSIFWVFHQIAFTNDLWLLNPDTDLLIRMMPQDFFERTVLGIGGLWAGCALIWHVGWRWALYRNTLRLQKREEE